MTPEEQVYAFERILPLGLKPVMVAAGINAFTIEDACDLQKDRPRAELFFASGSGQGIFKQITVNGEPYPVETSWLGAYEIIAVTVDDPEVHLAYLAKLRRIMFCAGPKINNQEPMTLHKLQPFIRDGGTVNNWEPQEGAIHSRLTFEINFSIQDDAWELIST